MKHTAVIWIERAAVVLLTLAILAGVLLWDAGLYDVTFIPRPGRETEPEETAPGTSPHQTEPDETGSVPDTGAVQTGPAETAEPYKPPEDMPDLSYPSLAELLAAGGKITGDDFVPGVTVLAKNETPACMKDLPLTRGTVQKSVIVRSETSAAGIALRDSTRTVPIRYVIPYMGYVIAYTDTRAVLLTVSGEMLNDNFPADAEPTFSRDEEGRPIVRTSGHYSAISSSGSLKPAVYTPDQNVLAFDMSLSQLSRISSLPTPFRQYAKRWVQVDQKQMHDGIDYFTSWQKKLVDEGMQPDDALKLTEPPKPVPETEPPVLTEEIPPETAPEDAQTETALLPDYLAPVIRPDEETARGGEEPEEPTVTEPTEEPTDPVETDPAETDPVVTDPAETDPAETDPVETDPTETDPVETDPVETDPVVTDPPVTEPTEEPTDPADETYYRLDSGIRWGYKDSAGNVVIEPRYLYAYPFGTDGLAAVIRYNDTIDASVLAFIDKTGKTKIDVSDKLLRKYTINEADVYDGYYQCLSNDETALGSYYFDHGYVRVRHRMVLRTKIYNAYIDEETLIDREGKEFPMPDGYRLIAYSDGVLLLEKGGKYGYMNYRGEWIAQPVYTYAEPFIQGLAVVGGTGAIGMIDTSGKFVINPNYDHVSQASRGVITAFREKDGWTLFNVVRTK